MSQRADASRIASYASGLKAKFLQIERTEGPRRVRRDCGADVTRM
jgi:hypothetical protein